MLSKYALLFGLAPIALAQNLPDFTGPYSVGTFDVELPVEEPRNTSDRKLAGSGEPAFLVSAEFLLAKKFLTLSCIARDRALHHLLPGRQDRQH